MLQIDQSTTNIKEFKNKTQMIPQLLFLKHFKMFQ